MIHHTIEDGALRIEGSADLIRFPEAVEEVVAYEEILVVRVALSSSVLRNVFGVDGGGRIRWQIEEPPNNVNRDLYLGIKRISDDLVRTYCSSGVTFDRDPRTGEVKRGILAK